MDPEERDDEEREYTRADYEADEADRKIKEMKIDGSYYRWRESGLSYPAWERRELEDAYLAGKAKAEKEKKLADDRAWERGL